MKRRLRQRVCGFGLFGASWLAPAIVVAQEAATKSGVVTSSSSGMNNVMEYGIVVVMFGAALFAICRGSRRNM